MDLGVDGRAVGGFEGEADAHLVDGFECGDFEEHCLLVGEDADGFHGDGVVADFVRVGHRVFLRTVGGGPAVVPLFHTVVLQIAGGGGFQFAGEGDFEAVGFHMDVAGQMDGFARVADAVEGAGARALGLPCMKKKTYSLYCHSGR